MTATSMRKEYERASLSESDAPDDPFRQFATWFDEAVAARVAEPNAMTLATADVDGRPSARIVLLRSFDARGFCFYTNYESRKGRELGANPFASLVFFWPDLERQVRIEGRAEPVADSESDAYFRSRPPGSKLGAWASPQSRVIAGRAALEERLRELQGLHPDGEIARPPHWGGYRIAPDSIEFWQGRASRLHDRLRYRRNADDPSGWMIERLAP